VIAVVLILAVAILVLAGTILAALWLYANHSHLDGLTDEEIAERLAPCVAAELMIMAAHDTDPPLEEPA
jgi:hypothetical protein